MHPFLSGSEKDQNGIEKHLLHPDTKHPYNFFHCILISLNSMLITNSVTFYKKMEIGVLSIVLLNIFILIFSWYSTWMFLHLIKSFHCLSLEDLWTKSGYKYPWVICLFVGIPCFFSISNIFAFIDPIISFLIKRVLSDPPFFMIDIIFDGLIIMILFVFPFIQTQNHVLNLRISYVSFVCLILFIGITIFMFIQSIVKGGFNPKTKISLFSKTVSIYDFTNIVAAYTTYPYLFTYIPFFKKCTFMRVKKLAFWIQLTIFIAHILTGLIQYFIQGNFETNSFWVLARIPFGVLEVILSIIFLGFVISSIPLQIYPIQLSILTLLHNKKYFPSLVWSLIGILSSLMALLFAGLHNVVFKAFTNISLIFLLFFQYIFPSIQFIKQIKDNSLSKWHLVGIIGLIIIAGVFAVTSFIALFVKS